ncbi:hypothetical protein TURU_117459 [Turdus rufiventris]|nr:hypothetical protein TURU_117459 [Turdus rufiventris]
MRMASPKASGLSWEITWLTFALYVHLQAGAEQSQGAYFLPEFALSPQGSFLEDTTGEQFLTYRYDDQNCPLGIPTECWCSCTSQITPENGNNLVHLTPVKQEISLICSAVEVTPPVSMEGNRTDAKRREVPGTVGWRKDLVIPQHIVVISILFIAMQDLVGEDNLDMTWQEASRIQEKMDLQREER